MGRYKVEDVGGKPRHLGKGTPREGLENSRYVMARLLRPGDTVSGQSIVDKIIDEDGEVTFTFPDGSHHSVG